VALAVIMGSKLLTALVGLVLLGLVVTVVTRRNWRGKEKVVAIEVAPAPEEPPKAPKKKSRKVAEEKVKEAVDAVYEALTDETEEIPVVLAEVPTEAPTEAPPVVVTETIAPATGNGAYKVKLPEGDLIPTETLAERFAYLDGLIKAEMAKPENSRDPEYICELQARQNLIQVRAGKHPGVKKDAPAGTIHKDFKISLEAAWMKENKAQRPGDRYTTGIYPTALMRGAMAESSRLEKIRKLKVEHDRLKGKAA
jgi:hypothetical protein